MWTINRKDDGQEIMAGYRMKDVSFTEARKSGFVGPDDDLVMLTPDGKIKKVDLANEQAEAETEFYGGHKYHPNFK